MAALIPHVDLAARVVYLPIRHHSPACAWHVDRVVRDLRPDVVLVEGPRNATPLIPLLTHRHTRMPVAFYTTYVRKGEDGEPERFAAYYPLCDYSPELAAVRAAAAVGARIAFIDLTFPEQVAATPDYPDGKVQSLLDERYLKHSRFLRAACQRAGVRDPDDLWDHLYEDAYQRMPAEDFFTGVLAYCALARDEYTPDMLRADGCAAREAAMAAHVASEAGRVVVVTGGFHSVALPTATPALPRPMALTEADAQTVLTRYSFTQLDRPNGYASGMPSPEFYQRRWEGADTARLIVEAGAEVRTLGGEVSVADEIAALDQAERLARMRGHARPGREDLLDGIRSSFVKGSTEVEGALVLTVVRNLLAGHRIGEVPREAGQPPIVADFRNAAARLRLALDAAHEKEIVLDLYRRESHRAASRLFHQLAFLHVPFAAFTKGPDFVAGHDLERMQEVWRYRWAPATEAALIERSVYGPTVEDASVALLLERCGQAETQGQGRRADVASTLLLHGCRMGLHRHTPDLLARTARLIAEDASVVSLAGAIGDLLLLRASREPLEAHHLEGLPGAAATAFERACYLLPGLEATATADEAGVLEALNALALVPAQLDDAMELRELLHDRLAALARGTGGCAAARGGAAGLLFGEGRMEATELVARLTGYLDGLGDPANGVGFLRGLLHTARSVLWLVPEVVEQVSAVLHAWDDERFVRQLPALRLAFANLTPRECDRVARAVADEFGAGDLRLDVAGGFGQDDLLHAAEVNRRVAAQLHADGLEGLLDG